MPAENQNFTIYAGDTHTLAIPVKDQDNGLQPLNLAGAELSWHLYREPHHIEILSKTTEAGYIKIISASEGRVEIEIMPADTESLKAGGDYTHALKVRDSLGRRSTVTTGKMTVKN